MADRYYTTREAAKALGVPVKRTWHLLRAAGVVPVGRGCREDVGYGVECVWYAADVGRVVRHRKGKTANDLRREAHIRLGIARRKAKREAA